MNMNGDEESRDPIGVRPPSLQAGKSLEHGAHILVLRIWVDFEGSALTTQALRCSNVIERAGKQNAHRRPIL